jgi:phage recombination protein Bet
MTTALTEREVAVPAVTADQLELVKKTVAQGATADELKLYLYDCARQGVHPLDRLVHFTKRSGKYTPITSIDFMRIRAADTGEYAGSDDAVFSLQPSEPTFAATMTVWRFVQGQRCAFAATARWLEYKPEANDFMWKKMPHTMLAKCAEALALRKGFPKQLAGLYAREEMDQAGSGQPALAVEPLPAVQARASTQALPDGAVLLMRVEQGSTSRGKLFWTLIDHNGAAYKEWDERRAKAAEQYVQDGVAVVLETRATQWGIDVKAIRVAVPVERVIQVRADEPPLSEYDESAF